MNAWVRRWAARRNVATRVLLRFILVLSAASIGFAGCGKNTKAAPPVALNGVSIDLPKLQQCCGSSEPAVRESVDKVRLSIRYADYRTALAELGKLSNNSDLSEAQKKIIYDISEQVKKAFANATPNSANGSVQ